MMQFTVNVFPHPKGSTLRYGVLSPGNTQGQSPPPIIFVPGLGGSVKNALGFLQRLAQQHGHTVLALDARGLGLNQDLKPQWHPKQYLSDLAPWLTFLQQTGQLPAGQAPIWVSISMGSALSTHFLSQQPYWASAHIMLAPAFSPYAGRFNARFKHHTYWQALTRGPLANITLPYGITDLTQNPDCHSDPHHQEPMQVPALYLLLVEQLCNSAFYKVKNLQHPIAIVQPQQDTICDPDTMAKAYQQLPNPHKQLLSYPNLYHDVAQEPDPLITQVTTDLNQWLAPLMRPQIVLT